VPTVFYPDYYGYPAPSGGQFGYHPTNLSPMKTEIDKLMKVLTQYVNGCPSVDYLNRFSTPYSSNFIAGSSNRAMIYQLQGYAGNGNRDVVVAINFGDVTLKVDHQINTRGGAIPAGTRFTDVLGRSAFPWAQVSGSNQIYMELPPRSYSVWVQGTVPLITRAATAGNTEELVQNNVAFKVRLVNNPVQGGRNTALMVSSPEQQAATMTVRNLQGQEMQRTNTLLHIGDNKLNINTAQLPAGTYYITLVAASQTTSLKMVKK
jgi:hypothetical protein